MLRPLGRCDGAAGQLLWEVDHPMHSLHSSKKHCFKHLKQTGDFNRLCRRNRHSLIYLAVAASLACSPACFPCFSPGIFSSSWSCWSDHLHRYLLCSQTHALQISMPCTARAWADPAGDWLDQCCVVSHSQSLHTFFNTLTTNSLRTVMTHSLNKTKKSLLD